VHVIIILFVDRNDETASTSATKTKIVDDEYSSASCSGEDTCKKAGDQKEIEEICQAINERETKYVFDAEESDVNEDPADILTRIKETRESEREEDRYKLKT